MFVACCASCAVCCFAACCVLINVVCCLLFVGCCSLCGTCRVMAAVACCSLVAAGCLFVFLRADCSVVCPLHVLLGAGCVLWLFCAVFVFVVCGLVFVVV